MIRPGKFITLEGGEGVGKSTNLAVVESFLSENNVVAMSYGSRFVKLAKNEIIQLPSLTRKKTRLQMYQDYIRSANKPKGNNSTINRKMGRLGNVNDVKEILEKIFKST